MYDFWLSPLADLCFPVMLVRRFCGVYHLFWVCATGFELLVAAAALSYTVLYWCHSNNNKGCKKSRNNSVASFIACIASPSMMQLQDGRCSKPALTPIPVSFAVSLSPQTRYQRSWWSLYTGTSTTRSTWSLLWPACSSLQSCTAGPGAWSSAAMPSNLCWDTTPSSRLWLRKACTWPTRTGWWRREIWPARPYTWWVDVNVAEHVTENILIVLLVFTFYSSVFCMFTPKRYMSTM